ncbi:hypothetical protein HanXRQr2_Chr08g0346871 [Helianthus annuus]|uniref:Uncharacterized protein n=1 Tax=Helianthus annuus TaxID=4232 RepID=A0A9K3IFI4_HELAN|nr:hypothetical protein HanXRQr2_Chr08g0346871 [Helianthus annuus]
MILILPIYHRYLTEITYISNISPSLTDIQYFTALTAYDCVYFCPDIQ